MWAKRWTIILLFAFCGYERCATESDRITVALRIVPENGSKVHFEGSFGRTDPTILTTPSYDTSSGQIVCGSATVSLESSTKDPVWHPKKETCSSSDTNTTINVNEKLIKGKQEDCGELFIACCTFEAGCSKNITTRVLKSEFNCSHPAEEMWVVLIRYAPQCTYDYEFKWVYADEATEFVGVHDGLYSWIPHSTFGGTGSRLAVHATQMALLPLLATLFN